MEFKSLFVACSLLVMAAGAVVLPQDLSVERRLFTPAPTSKYIAPSLDAFYRIPEATELAAYAPGDILRERNIISDISTKFDADVIASAYQLAYKTNTALGVADVTVTSVYKPKKPLSPPRVLAVSMYQDAASLDCANSFGLLRNTNSNHTLVANAQVSLFNAALKKGYYVTVPDFEGSQAAFSAGFTEGAAMLDGIRAILRHKATIPDPTGNEIVITGYSGGGHGAAWAAQLSKEHAPELNIIGVAHGGTPVDLRWTRYLCHRLAGVANAYPELESWLQANTKPALREILANLRAGAFCVPALLFKYAYKNYFSLIADGAAALDKEIPRKYFDLNTLGSRGAKDIVTQFPRLVFHAQFDQVIPEAPARKYVQDQCAGGAIIEYSLAIAEHASETGISLPKAFSWIVDAFDHKLNQTSCTRTTHGLADLFDPRFEFNAGSKAADQARSSVKLDFFKL